VLGVRQDTMRYFRSRLPHPLAAPVLIPLWVIDRLYRLLARALPTVVVGAHLEQQYRGPRARLLRLHISLVRAADVVDEPVERQLDGRVNLLAVGRIDPEKNPALLVDAVAELERRSPGRYRLSWVGHGHLLEATRRHAEARGVAHAIDFAGYVPFGEALLERYRQADVFVHVAQTEAFGQVLTEAMACGLPIVATAVGGVPGALDGGSAGLLVPPSDLGALTDAIEQISADAGLRRRLTKAGAALAAEHTLESEARRVVELIEAA
jgi:glycosyltransferase involved in cell wall biosynthesis